MRLTIWKFRLSMCTRAKSIPPPPKKKHPKPICVSCGMFDNANESFILIFVYNIDRSILDPCIVFKQGDTFPYHLT